MRNLRTLTLIGIASLLSGCGTTGTTSRFTLPLDPATPVSAARSLHVVPATMAADAARFHAVAVNDWGQFTAEDLANISQSLAATIDSHRKARPAPDDARFDIHLQVRRYIVGSSNTGAAVLACVAWAMVNPDGQVIYSSQFYAAGAMVYLGTVGGVKNEIHKAIVRRIATTALYVAADPASAVPRPTEFERSYEELDDAIANLPVVMLSRGDPYGMAAGDPGALFVVSAIERIQWEEAKPPTDFDWAAYLAD